MSKSFCFFFQKEALSYFPRANDFFGDGSSTDAP
jgi:hypothetical protein